MHRVSVKMKLIKGNEAEYKRRHDEIWPELKQLLKEHGIQDYSIFLDAETATLFAVMKVENPALLDELPKNPVMRNWWTYMKDIMLTNSDDSPVAEPLEEVRLHVHHEPVGVERLGRGLWVRRRGCVDVEGAGGGRLGT